MAQLGNPIAIGADGGGAQNRLDGTVDDVRVYATALSAADISAIYTTWAESYSYDQIGNMTSKNGVSYSYATSPFKPHAVSAVGGTSYGYDANGNMTTRGSQTLTWDVENRLATVSVGASFVYDGDGQRVKKTEGGETVLYVNRYYEKNLTTSVVTTSYHLGTKLIAQREGETLRYVHQDALGGTSVTTTSGGALEASIKYLPFGGTRSGSAPTDGSTGSPQGVKFTGHGSGTTRRRSRALRRSEDCPILVPGPGQ